MCINEINMAADITKTVLSALGFKEAAEGLGILRNLSNSLIFKSKDSKEVFTKNLQEGISAVIDSEKIDSSMQDMVNYVFANFFNENDLINYYDKKDELVENLLSKWGDSDKAGKDYEAFEKLVRIIINSLYDNIYEFIEDGELTSKVLKDTTEIKKSLFEINENVKQTLTIVKNNEVAESSSSDTVQTSNLTIVDDNDEYIELYNKKLFMESAVGDNKAVSLKNVFIEPNLENDSITLEEKLKTWRNSSNINTYEYPYADSSVFLLYGKAGVGKSSFTSYIISENILGEKCHAAILRKYADKLDHRNAWESVKEIYKCSDDKLYKGTILILDGLDEVCVLHKGFDGKAFIENLADNTPIGVKILITSRNYEGYFNEVKSTNDLTIETIAWTNVQIKEWCEFYVKAHNCKEKWCTEFLNKYNELEEYDKMRDIFCIPIILYICCVSEIDIEEHNSIAGIYDTAFKNIGKREHGRIDRNSKLKELDKRQFDINWQYTKELAYQMFLNGTLESALDNKLVKAAKAMTAKVCNTTETNIKPETERYYAVFHFVSRNSEGIEFAHKTVGEYFTAVKLYEDYFANTLTDISEESIENMWRNIFQAFRYRKIPKDIMQYFAELVKTRKTNDESDEENSYSEWRDHFINCYYQGMQEQLLWKMITQNTEYTSKEDFLLPEQVAVAFRNLTWFLTAIGFDNSEIIAKDEKYKYTFQSFFIRNFNMDVDLFGWKNLTSIDLIGANLCVANLNRVNLKFAELNHANLSSAYLCNTNLSHANLEFANLEFANLHSVNLNCVNLISANLKQTMLNDATLIGTCLFSADLYGTSLNNADLRSANLNRVDLGGANLISANLFKADLNDASLISANLKRAYLNRANLIGANLSGAYLYHANLVDANISGAFFIGADLSSIHLLESDLPKFDDFIKNDGVKLINPIIEDVDMTKYFYDPETNRMKPIEDK